MKEPRDLEKGLGAFSMDETELLARLGAKAKLIIPGPGKLSSFDVSGMIPGFIEVIADDRLVGLWEYEPMSWRGTRYHQNNVFSRECIIIAPCGTKIVAAVYNNLSGNWDPDDLDGPNGSRLWTNQNS